MILRAFGLVLVAALMMSAAGCSVENASAPAPGSGSTGAAATTDAPALAEPVSGAVTVDGSSTVFVVSQAVAEEFMKNHPKADVTVGTSGTGGGFKKFSNGEIDIADASRPIKESEAAACKEKGIEWVELKVAIDGLSVVVNPENDFCKALTVEQLKLLWQPDSTIKKWNELNPAWPAEEIKLYGADVDSGTFDYFTEVICGKTGATRKDYTPSADDNFLVKGVSGDKYSLGYFGYAYYIENKDKVRIVAIAEGNDPAAAVEPNDETIKTGTYSPLSRPLFIYANKASLKKPAVREFLKYYLGEGQKFVTEVGYIPLGDEVLEQSRTALNDAMAGGEAAATPAQ